MKFKNRFLFVIGFVLFVPILFVVGITWFPITAILSGIWWFLTGKTINFFYEEILEWCFDFPDLISGHKDY